MWQKIISFLTGAPVDKVAEYFLQRQEHKFEIKKKRDEAKHELDLARVEAEKARAQHIANWELMQIQNSGWKDEFVLLTISYPVYASFIPKLQDSVATGFQILGTTPYWYTAVVITIYLAVYGVRWKHASEMRMDWRKSADGNDQSTAEQENP